MEGCPRGAGAGQARLEAPMDNFWGAGVLLGEF